MHVEIEGIENLASIVIHYVRMYMTILVKAKYYTRICWWMLLNCIVLHQHTEKMSVILKAILVLNWWKFIAFFFVCNLLGCSTKGMICKAILGLGKNKGFTNVLLLTRLNTKLWKWDQLTAEAYRAKMTFVFNTILLLKSLVSFTSCLNDSCWSSFDQTYSLYIEILYLSVQIHSFSSLKFSPSIVCKNHSSNTTVAFFSTNKNYFRTESRLKQ